MNDVATAVRGQKLWKPSAEARDGATLTRYTRWLEETRGLRFDSYAALWEWSVGDLEAFWASIWEFCGVQAAAPYERVLGRREMPGAEWFPGARLNYAENLLAAGEGDRPALVGGASAVASRPNTRGTVVGSLATASLGAIWSSAAPEFGARSVIYRFG